MIKQLTISSFTKNLVETSISMKTLEQQKIAYKRSMYKILATLSFISSELLHGSKENYQNLIYNASILFKDLDYISTGLSSFPDDDSAALVELIKLNKQNYTDEVRQHHVFVPKYSFNPSTNINIGREFINSVLPLNSPNNYKTPANKNLHSVLNNSPIKDNIELEGIEPMKLTDLDEQTTTASVAAYKKPVEEETGDSSLIRRENIFSKTGKNDLIEPVSKTMTKLSFGKYISDPSKPCKGCEIIKEFGLGLNSRNSNLTCQFCGKKYKKS